MGAGILQNSPRVMTSANLVMRFPKNSWTGKRQSKEIICQLLLVNSLILSKFNLALKMQNICLSAFHLRENIFQKLDEQNCCTK